MAKKSDLLIVASELKLNVNESNTIAEIEAAIAEVKTVAEASAKEVTETVAEAKFAKAGKRSVKAVKEIVEEVAKEERKEKGDTTPQAEGAEAHATKGPKPITRPLIERRGKGYQKVAKLVDKSTIYSLANAVELMTKTSPCKFDASVEIHVRLGVDPRQADQNIRTTVSLPNGTGKKIRVAVFAPESDFAAAKTAGADIIGDEDFLKQLDQGVMNFDVLISTPKYMPRLGKYARSLGPKGLMPNPKSGTVATDVAKAVAEAKAGKVEYRVDKQAIVHLSIGKVSFGAKKLEENANAFFESLRSQKPSSLKGAYITSIAMSTTMGPGVKVENLAF